MVDKENKFVVVLCVGIIMGKKNVFVKDYFCCLLLKGFCLLIICMDIYLRKINLLFEREEGLLLVVNVIDFDCYEGFNFILS